MNDAPANSPALEPDGLKPLDEGWPWRKIIFLSALAAVAHFALVCFFGTKQLIVPRTVSNVPQLQLASANDELIALSNPALFALPNPRDFSSVIWSKTPAIATPTFNWTEPPQWLPLDTKNLGATFREFMRTNQLAEIQLNLKPQPELAATDVAEATALPQHSTLKILGPLARRGLLKPIYLPAQFVNDVIPPSKVQVLVNPSGEVVSAVLLPSNNTLEAAERNVLADQKALVIARQLRFTPAPQLTLGEMLFLWHTLPNTATNAPETQ